MPARPKTRRPKTTQQHMQARRACPRAQGSRPVQHWVPDLRDPKVNADLLRQGALLGKHPENGEIDGTAQTAETTEWT
jgi:antidote-toxin recognition MazE-like antitoxin